jgi:chitinase
VFRKATFLLVLGIYLMPSQVFAQQQWSQGYWTPWGNPGIPATAIEWGGLTHIVHAWALVRSDGSLDLDTQRISSDGPTLVSNAHANGVKALLGVGQPYWLGQTTNLQTAITNNRAGLVNNIINAMNAYGFDGVDLDWEPFSGSTNGGALQAFASDLRNRLGTAKTLSVAAIVNDYAFWGSVQGYFDRIGAMTYDLTGTWNPYSWHNAALYDTDGMVWSVDMAVRRFTAAGVPASKLSIGIPFFGYRWQGGGVTGPRQSWYATPSTQQIYYQGIAGQINGSNYRWDSSAAVPYLSMSDQFWTYDNEQSVAEKVRYAQNKGLGGWIIWELFGDYFPNQSPNQPLLVAIKNARTGSSTPPPSTPPPSTPPPSPPSVQSTLKATYVGAGQDVVGTMSSAADGTADWHIQLQGLRGTPTRVQITGSSTGVWEAPANGKNWVIGTQYAGNGTGDLSFEPWSNPGGFHVKVWYPDSSTDEVDASSGGGSGGGGGGASSSLKATYTGSTGQDVTGPWGSPNGTADWRIQLQGLRGTPTRVQITGSSTGVWEAPYNGTNWVVSAQYAGNGTGDLWFEPWSTPSGFHVKVWYSDSSTDEADATSGGGSTSLKATYMGSAGQDVVGPWGSPNGTADWHIQLQGLRATPARVQVTGFPTGLWEAPFNGTNWVVANQFPGNGTGDLWIEPWSTPTGFHVKVWYPDSSTDEVDATSGVASPSSTSLRATYYGALGQDVVGGASWSPNGVADWYIQLQGVRASIIKVRITSRAGGVWENPFNGANWVIAGDGYINGTQDLWFEPWSNPGGFHVTIWYSDGTTDQADTP